MAISMTGYGQESHQDEWWQISIQLRAVNHRYCEVSIRMPRRYSAIEDRIRRVVQRGCIRGRIEVNINIAPGEAQSRSLTLNRPLAEAYYRSLAELARLLNIPNSVDAPTLAAFPEILQADDTEEDLDSLWAVLGPVLAKALTRLEQMRRTEGEALARDMTQRAGSLSEMTEEIEARVPDIVREHREKLTQRLQEYLQDVPIDEDRILMEVAVFADRSNITEELVRLRSHLEQLKRMLETDDEVGKKLDFTVQEMNREVNTMGSKTGDVQVTRRVIAMKAEIEKIREQVQNLV
jgi:uncharacterized protein (TIGR00255 family)